MRVGFIVTSPYQLFHYKQIQQHLPLSTAFLEVRDRHYGLTEELVRNQLPGAEIIWVSADKLREIDGHCDAIVCQTPVPVMKFFSKSLIVAQQYSLAKEQYQYGIWRSQANLNLMYGRYSASCVSGFCTAVAVGNPLLDDLYADGAVPSEVAPNSRTLRTLYMPTYGDLSDKQATVKWLLDNRVDLSIKFHHAEVEAFAWIHDYPISLVPSDQDPIETILQHDLVVSDYSGAIFDSLAARRPVILPGSLNQSSRDLRRLSNEDQSRSNITQLVTQVGRNDRIEGLFEEARRKLNSPDYFHRFLERFYVNLGNAGHSCASAITQLVEEGEPEQFSVLQVRKASRRYILRNRDLQAQLQALHSVRTRSRIERLKDLPFRLILLKGLRWGLLRVPGGANILARLRGLRARFIDVSRPSSDQRSIGTALPLVPHLRREAMLKVLKESLDAHAIKFRTSVSQQKAYCAVPEAELDRLRNACNELGRRWPDLLVWHGEGARYDCATPAAEVTLVQIVEADSFVIGAPYHDRLYHLGRSAGVEVLTVRRRDARLVAKRARAKKVDWTTEFASSSRQAGAKDPVHSRRRLHVLENEPIDVVYTWVDSKDPKWREARDRWARNQNVALIASSNDERYVDRNELKYSLRSLWLYAPFIRHIFIVTAGHRPDWLDFEAHADEITVVAHEEIFPHEEDLPTFNSHAIEACLHRIPGLSEYFIYFNDDVFLGRETSIETYFSKAGLIKSRFSPSSFTTETPPDDSAIPTDWASYNATSLIARDFGLFFDRKMKHVPMPLRRSVLHEIEERYPDSIQNTRAARFRSQSDISLPSMFAHYYGVATGQAVEWDGKPHEYTYADTGRHDIRTRLSAIAQSRPTFLCLNVTRHTDIDLAEQKSILHEHLEAMYPVPSPFEKAGQQE